MKMINELFLAQYNQVWEQRRQHVKLIWTIPTLGGAVVAFFIAQLPFEKLNNLSKHLLFLSLVIFAIGVIRIFLRHNFFQAVYGLLISDLEREREPIIPLPQTGEQFIERYNDDVRKRFWENLGSKYLGINSWILIMGSMSLSLLVIWIDLTNSGHILCSFCRYFSA